MVLAVMTTPALVVLVVAFAVAACVAVVRLVRVLNEPWARIG